MQIDKHLLKLEFEKFDKSIIKLSDKKFISFNVGLPDQWESYKLQLRAEALGKLSVSEWTEDSIGSGKILSHVIDAIELKQNNLLNWQRRFGGDESRVHHVLHEPGSKAKQLEQWFFDFYLNKSSPAAAFDEFIQLANRNYSLIAYLYFLKDEESYSPIATTTFEIAFERLGFDIKLSHGCSWENYSLFNNTLIAVRDGLESYCNVSSPRLIDAHSFCWMLIDMERELAKPKPKSISPSPRTASPVVSISDPWVFAMHGMVGNAMDAVNRSGKPIAETTAKIKTCSIGRQSLEKYVSDLLEAQNYRCAFTGIQLDADREFGDRNLYPSLDRIDSQIGYEEGNLQVVCRFLNAWKSDQDDVEFRHLIGMLVDQCTDMRTDESHIEAEGLKG